MQIKIGTHIKQLRTERGMTQEALAERIGVSFQSVSKWETGTTLPDISLLPEIALLFGISIDSLFELIADENRKRIENMLENEYKIEPELFTWAERYLLGILREPPADSQARRLLIRLYGHRKNRDAIEALDRDYGIREGETVDWPRREMKRLEKITKNYS